MNDVLGRLRQALGLMASLWCRENDRLIRRARILLIMLVPLVTADPVAAAPLWSQMDYFTDDNGPNSNGNNPPATTWLDDFLVGSDPWEIDAVRFAGLPTNLQNDVYRVEFWSNDETPGSSPNPSLLLYDVTLMPTDYSATPIDTSGWAAGGAKFEITATLSDTFSAEANTRYWLSVYLLDNPFYWQFVVDDAVPAYDTSNRVPINDFNAQTSKNLAFELQGTAVPIPAGVWLLASGLVGLLPLGRRIVKRNTSCFRPEISSKQLHNATA